MTVSFDACVNIMSACTHAVEWLQWIKFGMWFWVKDTHSFVWIGDYIQRHKSRIFEFSVYCLFYKCTPHIILDRRKSTLIYKRTVILTFGTYYLVLHCVTRCPKYSIDELGVNLAYRYCYRPSTFEQTEVKLTSLEWSNDGQDHIVKTNWMFK